MEKVKWKCSSNLCDLVDTDAFAVGYNGFGYVNAQNANV